MIVREQLLSREALHELTRLRPIRPLLDTLFCWVYISACWTACALWPHWWSISLAIPVIGSRYYALFIIGHDAFHRRLFQNASLNDRFADLFIFGPIGAITRLNKHNHLAHHVHLSTLEDPDRHKHTCFSHATSKQLWGFLTGFTSVSKTLKNVFGQKQSSRFYHWTDLLILAVWQLGLIAGLSYFIAWWAYPLLWLLPVYLFTYLGDNLRSFAEHSQPYHDSEGDKNRLITYLSNPVERWFIAPMHMNYHAVHHLWPSIPYYNLPKADRLVRQRDPCELEWRGSYLAYLFRYARSQPLKECLH